jgi:hypothetical protein
MAEAPNITYLFIIMQIVIAYYFVRWAINRPIFRQPTVRPPSLRKQLRLQRRHRPKHQFRYHWFKQRMKRKKKRKFRKPKSLFKLTWQYKALVLTVRALLGIYKVGCRVERFVCSSLSVVNCLVNSKSLQGLINRVKGRVNFREANIVACEALLPSAVARARFNTDSFKIGVDTMCSVTMSGNRNCFEDLKPLDSAVGGIAGGLAVKGRGTFCFKLEDSNGKRHTIKLYNSLYVPGLPTTLLCPQHWTQLDDDDGTYIKSGKNGVWLVWGRHRFKKFVPLDPSTNTPTFYTAPGSFNYQAFETTYLACDASHIRRTTVLFDEQQLRGSRELDPAEFLATEDINTSAGMGGCEGATEDDDTVQTSNLSHADADPDGPCPIHPTGQHKWGECLQNKSIKSTTRGTLTFSPSQHRDEAEINNDAAIATDDQAELLRWHCRLGHLPFPSICKLAENGEIPKRLAKIKPPRCAGCLYGKMTKVPWRTKSKESSQVFKATHAGQCVSVDQLQSTQAGFIAQLKGKLQHDATLQPPSLWTIIHVFDTSI